MEGKVETITFTAERNGFRRMNGVVWVVRAVVANNSALGT